MQYIFLLLKKDFKPLNLLTNKLSLKTFTRIYNLTQRKGVQFVQTHTLIFGYEPLTQ